MSLTAALAAARRGRWIVVLLAAHLSSNTLGAQKPARERDDTSHALVPVRTTWPSTTAIAVVGNGKPLTVEATSDGWVVLSPVGAWEQSFYKVAPSRLELAPATVREWTNSVRASLSLPRDSSRWRAPLPALRLGRGAVYISDGGQVNNAPNRRVFHFQRCEHVTSTWTPSMEELSQLIAALDRAATVAEKGSPRPVPPTLDRPYYASELTCSATLLASSPAPSFPRDMPESQRRYADVGVRFVVDTSGLVEAGSVTVLPGVAPALERASRELVARWRFHPAVRGGLPVRQVISTTIAYDPARPEPPSAMSRVPSRPVMSDYGSSEPFFTIDMSDRRTTLATSEGWVRVRVGTWNSGGAFSGMQEWYAPDSVDAWAKRALDDQSPDPAMANATKTIPADRLATLSQPIGVTYEVRFSALGVKDSASAPSAYMRGCSGGGAGSERINRSTIERFVAAARAARAERATPKEPGDSVYQRGEVACQAILPDVQVLQEELNIRRTPRAPIPPSMDTRNARAEVLTSFVVGTDGIPKPATLVAMPGSDPRAVDALRASLGRYRFQPASRAGVPVNALVIRNWSFEPHPRCRDVSDGLDCPRVYSRIP